MKFGPHNKLYIGLVLDSLTVPAWKQKALENILECPWIELLGVLIIPKTLNHQNPLISSPILNFYRRLERLKLSDYPDPFVQFQLTEMLSGIPTYRNMDDLSRGMEEHQLDLMVNLSSHQGSTALVQSARYGVIQVSVGEDNFGGILELIRAKPYVVSKVSILTNELRLLELYQGKTPIDNFSMTRTQGFAFWKLTSLLPGLFEKLDLENSHFLQNLKSSKVQDGSASKNPNHHRLSFLLSIDFIHKYLREKLNNLFYKEQWVLLFKKGTAMPLNLPDFDFKLPPKDRFWGDPFIIKREGTYHCFFEESLMKPKKGYISVMTMDETGKWGPSCKVLEKPYHLSYPFLFEWEGNLFMIPESNAGRNIQLYKCVNFPNEWKFVHNMMEDIVAVDTTLFEHNKKWWLFTNIKTMPGRSTWDELHLYHGDSPMTQDWKPHKKNPIKCDVSNSRPAGRIFSDKGKIYRPAQNSSYRYGYGLIINEIIKLSESDYVETPSHSMVPSNKMILGIHTVNFEENLTVIDAIYKRAHI